MVMKLKIMSLALCLFLVTTSSIFAKDELRDNDSTSQAIQKLVKLGTGVHKVKCDKKGRIKTCVIVASSRISTVLGNTKGIAIAQKRAALAAKAEFVKWLKVDIEIRENSEDESTLFIEGSEENDELALRESGKSLEKTTETINSISKGLISGLELIHKQVNSDDKELILVYGWSAETAAAIREMEKNKNQSSSKKKEKRLSGKKNIKDKSVTSDNAKKFLE